RRCSRSLPLRGARSASWTAPGSTDVSRHLGSPVRSAAILAPDTIVERDDRGRLRARSPHPLGTYPGKFTHRLVHWAERAPDRTFLAVRDAAGPWRELTYRAALDSTRRIAQALLDRRLSTHRPVLLLSGNILNTAGLGRAT